MDPRLLEAGNGSLPVPTRFTLAASLGGPLAELSREAGGAHIEGHFLGRTLLVRLTGETTQAERLAKAFARAGLTLEAAEEAAGLLFLARDDVPERRLAEAVERAGGIVLPPLRWRDGDVLVECLEASPGMVERLRREVPGVRVARKKPERRHDQAELLREGMLLAAMTRKQAQALLAALDAGYYDVPRKVTTLEVARKLGVARSTFEEHLKRAEGQVVAALAPIARLKQGGPASHAEALKLYARFSEALGLYVTLTVRGEAVERVELARKAPPQAGPEHPYLARILEHLATGEGDLDGIPLHLEVSPFEAKVLDAMRAIPKGQVVTYAELAKRIGQPGAARAVGGACGRNPIPLIIPCHRVVPSDGSLGGYSATGGAKTKARLLELEGARREKAR